MPNEHGVPYKSKNWDKYLDGDSVLAAKAQEYIRAVGALARENGEGKLELRRGGIKEAFRCDLGLGIVASFMWGYPKGRLPGEELHPRVCQ